MPDDLLPQFVSTFSSSEMPDDVFLTNGELSAAHHFAGRRLREFTHGRYCARQALSVFGEQNASILIGDNRQPLWPPGFIGSISHTDDIAMAAVCRSSELAGLGIDCERLVSLTADVQHRILRNDEITQLQSTGLEEEYGTVIFSAKESIYKCLWPVVNRYIDFLDVSVELSPENNTFTVASRCDKLDAELAARVIGRWRRSDHHVTCAAFLDCQ